MAGGQTFKNSLQTVPTQIFPRRDVVLESGAWPFRFGS